MVAGRAPRTVPGHVHDTTAMSERTALKAVFGISLFGMLFSGTLTWRELFGSAAMSCPAPGAPGTVFGYPACVYGFFMYAVLVVVSGLALFRHRPLTGQIHNPGTGSLRRG